MTAQTTTKWWTLGVVSVATFMLLLDITVVNTALPAIQEDLDATFTDLQWVVDAYTLTLAAVVLTAGSLADRLGRRRVFAVGLGIFSIASLVAGLATDPTFLNIARGAQGVGGAVMFAVSLALIAQEFPAGRERGMAMGVYGATIGLAVAFGPLVGGVIVDSLSWEWIFFLNVPIGVIAIAISYLRVRESRDPNATRVDWLGLVTSSSALFLLVLGLIRGNEEGWGSTLIVGLFAASAVLLAAFIAIERRVAQPMLPLGLFRRPAFTGVQLAAFGISASMFALFLYLTLYLQSFLGAQPDRGRPALPAADGGGLPGGPDRGCAALAGAGAHDAVARPGRRGRGTHADGGRERDGRVDRPPRRLHRRRRRHRPAEPGDRGRGSERRAEGAERHGLRDQRHVPPGRRRARRRRLGSHLPRPRLVQGAGAHRARRGSLSRARRVRLLRQPRPGARPGAGRLP